MPRSEASDSDNDLCDHCGAEIEDQEATNGPEGEVWCWDCSWFCEGCSVGILRGEEYQCPGGEGGNEIFCMLCMPYHRDECSFCKNTTDQPESQGSASPSNNGSAS